MRAALYTGLLLAVSCWLLAWLSSGSLDVGGFGGGATVSPAAAFFLPLLWGVGGCCLGALVYRWRQQQPATGTGPSGWSGSRSASASAWPQPSQPPAQQPQWRPPAVSDRPGPASASAPAAPVAPVAASASAAQGQSWPCPRCGAANQPFNVYCDTCGGRLSTA